MNLEEHLELEVAEQQVTDLIAENGRLKMYLAADKGIIEQMRINSGKYIVEIQRLRAALKTICEWKNFPESNRFWDEEKLQPMSYEAAFGSNGERDYMRNIARTALKVSPSNAAAKDKP